MHKPQQYEPGNGNDDDSGDSEPLEIYTIDDAAAPGMNGIDMVVEKKVEAVCMGCKPSFSEADFCKVTLGRKIGQSNPQAQQEQQLARDQCLFTLLHPF